MNTIKKIVCTMLAVGITATMLPSAFASYTDVTVGDYCYEAVCRLGDLGIVSGRDDGGFYPQETITRAEFARIIVSALGKDTEAKSMGSASRFADVESDRWYAPYVNYVSANGIVSGYPDGSFAPDATISFSEALTVMLRMIEYREETVGYFWPNNYIEAGKNLGVSDDMVYDVNQPITRGDAAIMLDRTIFTDICNKDGEIILAKSNMTVLKDMIVLSSGYGSQNEVQLSNSNVYSSKMTIRPTEGQFASYAVLDKNGNLLAMKTSGSKANKSAVELAVFINGITDNTINYISNGITGTYRFDDNFSVYSNGNKGTFAQAKNSISAGCDLVFYGESYGNWSYAVVNGADNIEPTIANHDYTGAETEIDGVGIKLDGLTVYRDGTKAKLSDVKTNDVIYYNPQTNVMDVYNKKVTGVYYDAQPSKAYVETVTVGGKSYKVGSKAVNKLNATDGSFEIGDRVTLLLGKNDKAVFAVELSNSAAGSYGVVLGTGTQIAQSGKNEGSTEIYADIFTIYGETSRVVTERDYDDYIGKLVDINYNNGKATMTVHSTNSVDGGVLNKSQRTLDDKTLLKNVAIIQRTDYSKEEYAKCELLNLDTMTAKEIASDKILGAVVENKFGDISVLYVENVESTGTFGVISKVNKEGGLGYNIYTDSENSYNSEVNLSGAKIGLGVEFKTNGRTIEKITALHNIKTGVISAVDGARIKIGGTVYQLSPNVVIVNISGAFKTVSMEELESGRYSSATIYSDTSASSSCVIRVITVKN